MELRAATSKDRESWFRLWREFTEEQYAQGSVVVPGGKTYKQYLDLFNSYTIGSLHGSVLLAEADGKLLGTYMGGESPAGMNFETSLGKVAILWGIYTVPEYRQQGVSKAMMTRGVEVAKDLGFDSIVSEVLPVKALQRNAAAIGAANYTNQILVRLK